MDNRSVVRVLVIGALIALAALVIGIGAYNAGVARGIAEGARAIPVPPRGVPYVYGWPRPWGFGFFPVFPFFFLFLLILFFAGRGLFWRGSWAGGYGCRNHGVPPAFEEWHRRAHAEPPPNQVEGTRL